MSDKVIRLLFFLGVIAIPFDAISGIGAVGELSGEASFYFLFPAMLLYLATWVGRSLRQPWRPRRLSLLEAVALGIGTVVFASALFNMPTILAAQFHERSGFNKLITSNIVLVYGLLLALLASKVLPTRWHSDLIKPVAISAMLCIAFSALEALNRAGLQVPFYQSINRLVHAGSDNILQSWDGSLNLKLLEGWDERLRSVSFEPPAFGNFTGYAWPWLLASLLASSGRRLKPALLVGTFTLLILASQARTGQLLLACNLFALMVLRFIYAPPNGATRTLAATALTTSAVIAIGGSLIMLFTHIDHMTAAVVAGESVSDLSRLAYQTSAFSMFASRPLLGMGMGQFAFHAIDFMPGWAYLSPEVASSMIQPAAPWPNTYSLYARIAAETGVLGLLGWVAIWVSTMALLIRSGTAYARRFGSLPVVIYPLVMNCVAVLVSGITTDTFRTPMLWIALGGATAVLTSLRSRISEA